MPPLPPLCRQIFNILAEEPLTPAKWLVPRMRAASGTGLHFRYLTDPGALGRFLTAPWRKNRLIDGTTGEFVAAVTPDAGSLRRFTSGSPQDSSGHATGATARPT